MIYTVLAHLVAFLLDLLGLVGQSEHAKDLEILALRQQLRILQRSQSRPVRPARGEQVVLALCVSKLKALAGGTPRPWRQCVLLFTPDTVLRWHRELVRRKWTMARPSRGGRPRTTGESEALILRLARENPCWGYKRIDDELGKLGYTLSRSTVRAILARNHVPPAPERRRRGSTWRPFLRHHAHEMLACDFLTVETALLRTVYVLFFIELGSRRVYLAGCTRHPTSAWVAQQARNQSWRLQEGTQRVCFLIHDRDTKFSDSFDRVFVSEGVEIVRTPYRAPNANAIAERWIRTVRTECLDQLLILSERHLQRVLGEYLSYYNERRPHQGLAGQCPLPLTRGPGGGPIKRRDVLGGLIHDYEPIAA
jgi:transposase InsO family protein